MQGGEMKTKQVLSILIIGLLSVYLVTGNDLTMQIGLILSGILIILNIVLNQSTKRIAKLLYICCAILLILIGAHAYFIDLSEPYLDRATDVTYEIRTALKQSNGNFDTMGIVTGKHAWDRLYLLPPLTDVKEFLKQNNLSWYGDKKENIKYQKDTALIIFTLGNKVSCYAEIKQEDSKTDLSEVVQVNNVINSFMNE